jgi:clan AA aspartic protease
LALTGVVTVRREAVLRLTVLGTGGRQAEVEAILDTGFTGHLTLPRTIVDKLAPRSQGVREAVLADGHRVALETFRARVVWDGETREVQVLASRGGDALVGMALLWGYEVRLRVEEGGAVVIERLPRSRP